MAARLPGRGELTHFADWRAEECQRRGVELQLETEATAEMITAMAPDAVVIATGGHATKHGSAKWHRMPIDGAERDFVLDHEQALERADEVGQRVVILDTVGHIEGIGLAEMFAVAGREVTLAMPTPTPMNLDAETMTAALPRATYSGARWRPTTAVASIGDHEITLVDLFTGKTDTLPVDTVVIRTHGLPNDGLYFELKDKLPFVKRIGDAVAVRTADRAIFDGHTVGREI